MAEAAAGKVVVLNFTHQFELKRLPLSRAFCAPATRASGSMSGKTGAADQRLDDFPQVLALLGIEAGGETDVIELLAFIE